LETDVRLLTNPVFIRMAVGLIAGAAAFVAGIVGMRMLRRGITEDGTLPASAGPEDALPLHTYAVIQQLKQQKFALQNEQQLEKRRAKTSEHITAAIMASLPCGIVFVAPNGLVRQTNAAARQILGFASPQGMTVDELFRGARMTSESGADLKETFGNALRGKVHLSRFECQYFTPNREDRTLRFTLIPVTGTTGEGLGIAAAISDESEAQDLRQAQVLKGEISAEMALELRTSLATIRDWAQQISTAANPSATQNLASDISAQAERVEKVVGAFLAGSERARAAHT
jgi:nitrogen-specific signal transduction histidine kinase